MEGENAGILCCIAAVGVYTRAMNNNHSFLPDYANLRVTYTDGTEETFTDVRYQVNRAKPDPVVIKENGTVVIETAQARVITILGVRRMEFM